MRKRQKKKNYKILKSLFTVDKAMAIARLIFKQQQREFYHRMLGIHPLADISTSAATKMQIDAIAASTFKP